MSIPARQCLLSLSGRRPCLTAQDGLLGSERDPLAPGVALFFDGLLRREGKRLVLRCPAVRRLATDYVAGQ